jgi:hypothetical protein
VTEALATEAAEAASINNPLFKKIVVQLTFRKSRLSVSLFKS